MHTVAVSSLTAYGKHSSISASGRFCTSSQRVHRTRCPWLHFVLPLPARAATKRTRRLSKKNLEMLPSLGFLAQLDFPCQNTTTLVGPEAGF